MVGHPDTLLKLICKRALAAALASSSLTSSRSARRLWALRKRGASISSNTCAATWSGEPKLRFIATTTASSKRFQPATASTSRRWSWTRARARTRKTLLTTLNTMPLLCTLRRASKPNTTGKTFSFARKATLRAAQAFCGPFFNLCTRSRQRRHKRAQTAI